MTRWTRSVVMALLGLWALGTVSGGSGSGRTVPAPDTTLPDTTFTNPVIPSDFPDPFILHAGGSYYAYATNAGGADIQLAVSSDLVHWQLQGDAMGALPSWAQSGFTWAPEVIRRGDGFLMYFTARDRTSQRQCLGVARSDTPTGPFRDDSAAPLACQVQQGGSIDPSPFLDDDGRLYLLWKSDGNCCGLVTHIYLQPLSADGRRLTGQAHVLISNDAPWEGRVVEAPTMVRRGGLYYLLYSGGAYGGGRYAVGDATARTLAGPFVKDRHNPVLSSRGDAVGPGHQGVITDAGGQDWLSYHAWTRGAVGYPAGVRSARLDPVRFVGGQVKVDGPQTTPETAPVTARQGAAVPVRLPPHGPRAGLDRAQAAGV